MKILLIKRPNGMWNICLNEYVNGKTKNQYISLGTKDEDEATTLYDEYLSNHKTNVLEFKPDLNKISLLVFYHKIKPILETNLTKGTQKIYRLAIENFIKVIGNKSMIDYSIYDIEKYKAERIKKVSNSTINIDLCTLKSFFNMAIHHEFIEKNIFYRVKKLPVYNSQIQILTDEQFNMILNKTKNPIIRNIYQFAWFSGLRISEILSIRWQDITSDEILIYSHKVHKTYHICINDKLRIILYDLDKSYENIFGIFNIKSKGYISRKFKKIIRSIPEIPNNIHLHNLRHSFISSKISKGVPVSVVQQMVNHSSVSTTERYIHISNNAELKRFSNVF